MRIRELRQELNYTQEELGKKIGQTKSNISKYETGALEPGIDTLKVLSIIFNVSLDFLLGKSNTRNPEQQNQLEKPKDKPITDVEEAMKVILDQPGLMLNGTILSDESKIILANSILNGIKLAEELEKHKKENSKEGESND